LQAGECDPRFQPCLTNVINILTPIIQGNDIARGFAWIQGGGAGSLAARACQFQGLDQDLILNDKF
jgi:hypothetical protein